MRPQVQAQVSKTANLAPSKSFKMRLSAEVLPHIMQLLTKLYSDEEGAVIREYSTNAMDSHILAGQTLPIEVFLPDHLSPVFRIRDYGVGLSLEEMEEIYAGYGESTKRTDERMNGFMGIGSKSALAYTNEFTVIAIKDGRRVVALVSRGEDGVGQFDIISDEESSEGTGVEVIVPISGNTSLFSDKVRDFFKFWPKGSVLIDGEEVTNDFILVKDNILWSPSLRRDYFVMGGVAYPLITPFRGYSRQGIAVYVEMNSDDEVTITPNREELIYDGVTNKVIKKYEKIIRDEWNDFVSRLAASGQTDDFLGLVIETHTEKITVNGTEYNSSQSFMNKGADVRYISNITDISTGRATRARYYTDISLGDIHRRNAIFLYNYPKTSIPAHDKGAMMAKARELLDPPHWDRGIYISDKPYHEVVQFFAKELLVDWDDIKDTVVLPDRASGPRRKRNEPPTLDFWMKDATHKHHVTRRYDDIIPDGSSVIYVLKREFSGFIPEFIKSLILHHPTKKFVYGGIYANKEKALLRHFPDAIRLGATDLVSEYHEMLESLGIDRVAFHQICHEGDYRNSEYLNFFSKLRASGDTDLVDFATEGLEVPVQRVYTDIQRQVVRTTPYKYRPEVGGNNQYSVTLFDNAIRSRFPLINTGYVEESAQYLRLLMEQRERD